MMALLKKNKMQIVFSLKYGLYNILEGQSIVKIKNNKECQWWPADFQDGPQEPHPGEYIV